MAKITQIQKDALLSQIAYLIVNKKNELILAMNKSGIKTVSIKTPNKIVANVVVEELNKNKKFAKNLSDLITDINIKNMINDSKNATGENEQGVDVNEAVNLGAKVYEGISGLAEMFGLSKSTRDASKNELDKAISEEEQNKTTQDNIDKNKKIAGKFTTTGVVLTILGAGAIITLAVILYKKYGK